MGNEGIPTSILVFVLTIFLSSVVLAGVLVLTVLILGINHAPVIAP
ncbi:MAG TPA: hypothetical protein VN415_04945 [Dehalococcoidia bacterium]|jgi:hypothetical protein|nr:hypothetical protein [Dehalococcoidia bacterium]